MSDKEETFRQYEDWRRIKEQVESRMRKDPGLREAFPAGSIDDTCRKLSHQIRWVKWSDLKRALEKCVFSEEASFESESRFCRDLVDYLDLKINIWTRILAKKD
jgi:hypothetical protein